MTLSTLPHAAFKKGHALVFLIAAASLISASFTSVRATRADADHASLTTFIAYDAPDLLSYEEVVELGKSATHAGGLRAKIDALLGTAFISNETYLGGRVPEVAQSDKLGSFIRVGFWNIQRGLRLDEIKMALEGPEMFKHQIPGNPDGKRYREIEEQLEVFRSVDILALNEVDLGLKRTEYKDVARELAAALKMNYAYGVEFLEVDPLNVGTESFQAVPLADKRASLRQVVEVDKLRYRGLHGTAILSRFPIKRARLVPLNCQPYDWYREESKRVSIAELARRQIGRIAFLTNVPREIRYGGRAVLIAELHIPQLPGETLTVVATHLESHCQPRERRRQMQEVLSLIKDIKGPVVLTGDFNTSGTSTRPTSIRNELMKRIASANFWTRQAIKAIIPFGFAVDFTFEAVGFARTGPDPTAKGIMLLAPNKEAGLFKDLERFRFADGHAFDFRGDPARTVNGTSGTLANSNQRAGKKGFISTHAMERTYWAVGKSKIDWIFVKAFAKDPRAESEPYRLAPHFARTLEKLNYALGHRLSDHNPITVDLPVEEPRL